MSISHSASTKTSDKKKEASVSASQKVDASLSGASPLDSILFLQQKIGNQACGKLLRSSASQPGDSPDQPEDNTKYEEPSGPQQHSDSRVIRRTPITSSSGSAPQQQNKPIVLESYPGAECDPDPRFSMTAEASIWTLKKLMDEYGWEIFQPWFYGSTTGDLTIENERWQTYMLASKELQQQVQSALSAHGESLQARIDADPQGTLEEDFFHRFHGEVGGKGGGYFTGYQLLHGSNKSVGDVEITGRFQAVSLGGPGAGYKVTYRQLSFVWNDIVDQNKTYATDIRLAQFCANIASCLKVGPPKDYILHIKWKSGQKVEIAVKGKTKGTETTSSLTSRFFRKIRVGAVDDPLEREADAVAEQVMKMPIPALQMKRKHAAGPSPLVEDQEPVRPRRTHDAGVKAAETFVPDTFVSALGAGSHLSQPIKDFFEPRFGFDFGKVRVHTNPQAAESARSINARAYTLGNDIVFGAGEFHQQSEKGKKLIAHELAHVVQQHGSGASLRNMVQREPAPKSSTKTSFPYSIHIGTKLTADQLLIEFIKQYHRIISDEDALKLKTSENWHWIGPEPTVTDTDVAKKYKLVTVAVNGIIPIDPRDKKAQEEAFGALPKDQQKAINDQADKDFWAKTNYKPGKKLGVSADDQKMAKTWMQFRDRLVQEKDLIDKMPELMKKIIANPENYAPQDYEQLSRIISKLNFLSAGELADYINKITATTTDLTVLETSVDKFRAQLAQRKEEDKARDIIKTRLYGTEDIYEEWKHFKSIEQMKYTIPVAMPPGGQLGGMPTGPVALPSPDNIKKEVADAEALLLTHLKANNFNSIAEFEKMIHDFEAAFELESQRIASDILDKYAHVLYEAEEKYSNDAEIDALHKQLAGTGAKAGYEKSSSLAAEAKDLSEKARFYTVQGAADKSPTLSNQSVVKQRQAQQEKEKADASIAGLSSSQPLLSDKKMDRRALAFADKEALKAQLLFYIQARCEDITSSRQSLKANPGLVYKADELFKKSYLLQGIQPNSIYDKIIRDKIREITIDDAIVKGVGAVIAVALGIVTMGGGTVGVLAAAGAFGISAYQAVEEYRDYEVKMGLAGTDLISSDPSLFWVIASIVAAGLDLGMVASSIKSLSPAVKAFNETHDLAQFEKSLAELADVDAKLKANLVQAARNEAKYQESIADFLKVSGRAYAFAGIPDPEMLWKLGKLAYAALRKGINSFDKFLLELKAQKIIKNIESLSAEEKVLYKKAWLEALEEDTRLSKIQTIGDKLPLNAEDFASKTFSFDLSQNPVAKMRLAEKYAGAELAERTKAFEALAKKYPEGVRFTSKGFPDFTPYTVKLPNGKNARFKIKTTGNRSKDFTAADKVAGIDEEYRQANELVWHHMEDMETMILVPRDVHKAVKHSGGISVFTNVVVEE